MKITTHLTFCFCLATCALTVPGAPWTPIPETVANSARHRWENKPVLESRLLDDAENPANWMHDDLGRMTFATERAKDGKQSVRLHTKMKGDQATKDKRAWGSSSAIRKVGDEDWSKWNRVALWVYPDDAESGRSAETEMGRSDHRAGRPLVYGRGPEWRLVPTPGSDRPERLSVSRMTTTPMFSRVAIFSVAPKNNSQMLQQIMKKFYALTIAALTTIATLAQDAAPASNAADQLGWQLAVHSWTFQKFSLLDVIDKTAALGVKHMSISGSYNREVNGKLTKLPTPSLSDAKFAAIQGHMKARGLSPKFLNMGVVKPGTNEVESRRIFAAAKRFGIDVLVAESKDAGQVGAVVRAALLDHRVVHQRGRFGFAQPHRRRLARADAEGARLFYQNFGLELLKSPYSVGWQWFKYQDNDPKSLRTDPSNRDSNKGIVDSIYKPFPELLAQMKQLNQQAYHLINHFDGRRQPDASLRAAAK